MIFVTTLSGRRVTVAPCTFENLAKMGEELGILDRECVIADGIVTLQDSCVDVERCVVLPLRVLRYVADGRVIDVVECDDEVYLRCGCACGCGARSDDLIPLSEVR